MDGDGAFSKVYRLFSLYFNKLCYCSKIIGLNLTFSGTLEGNKRFMGIKES